MMTPDFERNRVLAVAVQKQQSGADPPSPFLSVNLQPSTQDACKSINTHMRGYAPTLPAGFIDP
jgi:hypothetical protein